MQRLCLLRLLRSVRTPVPSRRFSELVQDGKVRHDSLRVFTLDGKEYDNKNRGRMRTSSIKTDNTTKRFFRNVKAVQLDSLNSHRFGVLVGGRLMYSPKALPIVVPTAALARALAVEWDRQRNYMKPHSMPMMQMAVISTDQIGDLRQGILDKSREQLSWDATVIRVKEPAALRRVQIKRHQPLLKWLEDTYDIRLNVSSGDSIDGVRQDPDEIQKIIEMIDSLDDQHLAVFDQMQSICNSIVIALATVANKITVEQAYEAARLDENYQIRNWGKVEGVYGHGTDIEYYRQKIGAVGVYLSLLKPDADIDRPQNLTEADAV